MRRSIWMLGLATFLFVVLVSAVFAGSLLARGGSSTPGGQTSRASSIASDQAVAMVKEWIRGGTQVEAVQELLGDLICSGYYEANGTWEVRCRLPWIPAEGYVFSVAEESGEVTAETEATMEFVRLLRQWGQVPEP
jgi:hypothetical protein